MSELNDVMKRCRAELPEGFGIEINIEEQVDDVHLIGSDGECIECFESDPDDGLIEGAVIRALERAKALAANPNGETVN